jgi:hypothetical protein
VLGLALTDNAQIPLGCNQDVHRELHPSRIDDAPAEHTVEGEVADKSTSLGYLVGWEVVMVVCGLQRKRNGIYYNCGGSGRVRQIRR